jgi:hypothetical protein
MALQSRLLQGDRTLEECLVRDSAHVTLGAVGAHVIKIQKALLILDDARIDSGELAMGRYGQSTASAVLAFKKKRNIINRTYQSQADNIVGKMTIAALDKEMSEKENEPHNKKKAYIYCSAFPTPSFVSPRGFRLASIPIAQVVAPISGPRQEALRHKQDAIDWVNSAIAALNTVAALMFPSSDLKDKLKKLETMEQNIALNTHFKLSNHPNPLQFISALGKTYLLIANALQRAESLFTDDPTNLNAFAYVFPGAFHSISGRIFFCPQYMGKGPLFQTGVIVHEAAHFVDSNILHFASELPSPDGTPVDSSKNYAQLTPDEAARNAYSYAQFALHAFKGFDKRIVPFNE